jgi:hypothetical protein
MTIAQNPFASCIVLTGGRLSAVYGFRRGVANSWTKISHLLDLVEKAMRIIQKEGVVPAIQLT